MKRNVTLVLVGLAVGGVVGACANTGIPAGGPHFASWTHARYSLRGGERPRLTKADLEQAKREGWWGAAIRYTIDELE